MLRFKLFKSRTCPWDRLSASQKDSVNTIEISRLHGLIEDKMYLLEGKSNRIPSSAGRRILWEVAGWYVLTLDYSALGPECSDP